MPDWREFSGRFKYYRERAGYGSQQEFAARVGFSRVQVGRWESNSRPAQANMPVVVAALRISTPRDVEEFYRLAGFAAPNTQPLTPAHGPIPECERNEILRRYEQITPSLRRAARIMLETLADCSSDYERDQGFHKQTPYSDESLHEG